jgi:hypothetical protein
MIGQKVLDRFIEVCASGADCGPADKRSRQYVLYLSRHSLLSEAIGRVIALGKVHPLAQRLFLETWIWVPAADLRASVGDDDLFFDALRMLLPPYDGQGVQLYRGQLHGQPPGMSWTSQYRVATTIALFGMQAVGDPDYALANGMQPRDGAEILEVWAHKEILCTQSLLGNAEAEYTLIHAP